MSSTSCIKTQATTQDVVPSGPMTLHKLIAMFEAAGFDDRKAGQHSFENFSFVKFFEAYRAAEIEAGAHAQCAPIDADTRMNLLALANNLMDSGFDPFEEYGFRCDAAHILTDIANGTALTSTDRGGSDV